MISEKLVTLRERNSLTKKYVATQLGIHESTYGKYELGRREPSIEMICQLAEIFECSTDYLLTDNLDTKKDSPEKPPDFFADEKYSGYMAIVESAESEGISPDDLGLALDFLRRARERDEEA